MSKSDNNYIDGACDGVCEMMGNLQNMSTADDGGVVSGCANCGKEGANNVCNKCKQVKYCNAACKKKHRSKLRNGVRNMLD